jgi:hypothetical protein
VLVVGATAFGRAVVVEIARQWWALGHGQRSRLRLTLVDERAGAVLAGLSHRYPFMAACELSAHDGTLEDPAALDDLPDRSDRVFICLDDEQQALKTALTTDRLWRGAAGSVLVRQEQFTTLRTALDAAQGRQLFDEVSETLRLFGVVDAASDPELIRDDLVERLARFIHESYLVGLPAGADQQEAGLAAPSRVPWQQLPEWLKRANRSQAADIGRKMRSVGCVIAPRIIHGREHVLGPLELERLAELEHQRWLSDRVGEGWRYCADRADAQRLHPAIVDWSELPETFRERNRKAVGELPCILANCGFRIVRR